MQSCFQNTNTYEMYRIANSLHQSVDLAPDQLQGLFMFWLALDILVGYTLDVTLLSAKQKRRELISAFTVISWGLIFSIELRVMTIISGR